MEKSIMSMLLIVSSVLLVQMFFYAIKRRHINGAFSFSILLLAMSFHTFGYAFELLSETLEHMYFWIRFEYIGVSFYPFLIMMFARYYTDERRVANKYLLSLILMVNLVTLILVNTNSYHWLYYASVKVDHSLGLRVLNLEKGIWYYTQVITLCFSNIYGIFAFSNKLQKSKGKYREKTWFMLVGVIIPMVVFIIYFFGIGPRHIDLMPFAYIFMSVLLWVGLFRYKVLFLMPVTYEMIFNAVDEAVIVTDKSGILIRFNNASKLFFPSLENINIGEHVDSISELSDYDFKSDNDTYRLNDKIYKFKLINMESNGVKIYVANDITESENIKKQLKTLASLDPLTGIYNRRYFMGEFKKSKINGVFVIIDIDHFKGINDKFGHIEGDNVLSYFAEQLKSFFKEDMICRYGGEEFAIFISNNNLDDSFKKMNEFRNMIASREEGLRFTFSAGLAVYENKDIEAVIDKADKKLYEAKANGRNQVRY